MEAVSRPATPPDGTTINAKLEEIAENPYRIDRQLTQLLRTGWFDDVRGIVCGGFIDCGDPENPWQSSTPFGPDPP